jgi:hypothetical protein
MGILQCAVAKALGAAQIVVVDIDVHRVTFACNEAFATSGHVLPRKPHNITPEDSLKSAKETAHQLLKMFRLGTDGFDVVFECTGVESCIQTAIFVSRLIFLHKLSSYSHVAGCAAWWEGSCNRHGNNEYVAVWLELTISMNMC